MRLNTDFFKLALKVGSLGAGGFVIRLQESASELQGVFVKYLDGVPCLKGLADGLLSRELCALNPYRTCRLAQYAETKEAILL